MESELNSSDSLTISDYLEQMCPVYMAYGMTYDDYWHGDMEMAKAYREAYKIKQKQENAYAHRQGAYFYEAIVKGIANTFGKSKDFYTEYPYPLTEEEKEKQEEIKEIKIYEENKAKMLSRFSKINKSKQRAR